MLQNVQPILCAAWLHMWRLFDRFFFFFDGVFFILLARRLRRKRTRPDKQVRDERRLSPDCTCWQQQFALLRASSRSRSTAGFAVSPPSSTSLIIRILSWWCFWGFTRASHSSIAIRCKSEEWTTSEEKKTTSQSASATWSRYSCSLVIDIFDSSFPLLLLITHYIHIILCTYIHYVQQFFLNEFW